MTFRPVELLKADVSSQQTLELLHRRVRIFASVAFPFPFEVAVNVCSRQQ